MYFMPMTLVKAIICLLLLVIFATTPADIGKVHWEKKVRHECECAFLTIQTKKGGRGAFLFKQVIHCKFSAQGK